MRVKLSSGEELDASICESSEDGELLIVVGRTVKLSPDECTGLQLLDAKPAELEALVCAGYGRTLAGLDELLKTSGARLWRVEYSTSGEVLGEFRASTRSGAILACLAHAGYKPGSGPQPDLFARPVEESGET